MQIKKNSFHSQVTIYKIPQILYEEYDATGNNYGLKQFKKSNAVPNMDLLNPGIPGVQLCRSGNMARYHHPWWYSNRNYYIDY